MAEERKGGLGNLGRERFRENLGSKTVAGHEVTAAGQQRADNPDVSVRELPTTPWERPASSRVSAYQYDYATGQLRVRFVKYSTPWVYNDVPVAVFQAFDAAPSKGMYINSTLNYMDHRKASPAEQMQHFND